jgi:hypothetical protein
MGNPMGVFVISNLMFIFLFRSSTKLPFSTFKEIEKFLTDNNQLHKEILPLVLSDIAAANAADSQTPSSLEFTYLNTINQSMMMSSPGAVIGSTSNQATGGEDVARRFWSTAANFVIRSGSGKKDSGNGSTSGGNRTENPSTILSERMHELISSRPEVSEIAVKRSPNEEWKLIKKSKSGREMFFSFKNPKFPLWKILEDINVISETRFSSVYI